MKYKSTYILILIFLSSLFLPISTFANDELTGHYAEQEMRMLIKEKIMEGNDNGHFLPESEITRAEFVKLIVESMNFESDLPSVNYTDVDKDAWYYPYVVIASNLEIVEGTGINIFEPEKSINRQEMAVIIKRAMDKKGITFEREVLSFADKDKIADWAYSDIEHLVGADIIRGVPKNDKLYFSPTKNAPRAQAAITIYRILHNVDPEKYPKIESKISKEYKTTNYPYDFKTMVDSQVNSTPKVDGAGTYTASRSLVSYYANPSNFAIDSSDFYQFLLLSRSTGVKANELNDKFLKGNGTLAGQGAAFVEAAGTHKVNELYLITHALHETGNGTSKLASGIEVGLNKENEPEMVTEKNRDNLTAIKKTYNMFGVQAFDTCPQKCGSEHAYDKGWFTPHKGIVGGATFISNRYIDQGQDTLYKMRWNPESKSSGLLGRQYATHVQWATSQAKRMHDMYIKLDTYSLAFDVPAFSSQPGPTNVPQGISQYAVLKADEDEKEAWTTAAGEGLNFREGPTRGFKSIKMLPYNTKVTVLGKNGGWYKVKAGQDEGWVSGTYLSFKQVTKTASIAVKQSDETPAIIKEFKFEKLNELTPLRTGITVDLASVYTNAELTGRVQTEIQADTKVILLDEKAQSYQVKIDDIVGWVSVEKVNKLEFEAK